MGRQWLHAKRLASGLKKGQATGKLVREITVAAKMGGADPDMNARLYAAIEKAKKESVTRDAIERAIKKGAGIGDDTAAMELVLFEGYAPHKVAVMVEIYTDNINRTLPDVRVLFKKGQLGSSGSNKFLFDHVGLVEAFHSEPSIDHEAAAIEAGANDFKIITNEENDDIPEKAKGLRFICERTEIHSVAKWLSQNGWSVITAEMGYLPKQFTELTEDQKEEVGSFLQAIEDHDDVHRVWATLE